MIYLDNAATSWPKPESVYREMDRFHREFGANPGRSGHRMAVAAERKIEETRHRLAQLFNAPNPSRIVLTLNATDALNMAIKGVLRPGDHAVTTLIEHNSVSRPLMGLEREGVSVTHVAPNAGGFVEAGAISAALRSNTRLIALTHASNVLGTIQPAREVGRLAREKNILFLLDAAQTAGLLPIDVVADGVDLLAFPGHKSLLGPTGTGGLYVGERAELSAWREGGTGADSASPEQPNEMPFRLEAGTPNVAGIAGLCAGLKFIEEKGIAAILEHERGLLAMLIEELRNDKRFTLYGSLDVARRVPTLALNIAGWEPTEVGTILDQNFGIAVRTGLHCAPSTHKVIGAWPAGSVRLSPGYFNTETDVEQVLAALRQIASAKN
jgi:cysteine desulfurase family protein